MANIPLTSPSYSLVKNQKAFKIYKRREQKNSTDVRISDLFKNDILYACRDLKETTFKLYIYLVSNQDGYIGGLSCSDVMAQTGISESSYKRAVKELVDKGYLVYTNKFAEDSTGCAAPLYNFFSTPTLGSN